MTKPPRRRASPRLSAEDREIWERVVRSATPLHDRPASARERLPLPPPSATEAADEPHVPRPAHARVLRPEGRAGPTVRWSLHDPAPTPVGRPEPGIDRRTAERLRRGERAPDARIDLHGLTAERAHARLDRFVAESLRAGHRCVLVITGKGGRRSDPDEASFMRSDRGVLRQAAPQWLRSGPHARRIVGIFEAHPRHGGAGAFYLYLKRGR